jgi:hypothetical protein
LTLQVWLPHTKKRPHCESATLKKVVCSAKVNTLKANQTKYNEVSTLPSHVCRLHKSLYGLKQAPRAWYTHLSDFLLSIGFLASKVDTSLFILSDGTNIFYLLVYVNDILLTGSNSVMIHRLIQLLSSDLKLRDLGTVHYFLGIEVQSTGMGLMLRQHKYILDILTRAGMTSSKLVDTLVSPLKVTILLDTSFSDPTRFHQIMSAL